MINTYKKLVVVIGLFFLTLFFTCCNKSGFEYGNLSTVLKLVDNNSAFSMKSFAVSMEQFGTVNEEGVQYSVRPLWSFSHDIENKMIVTSSLHQRVYGEFGRTITFEHEYNTEDVIVSSEVEGYSYIFQGKYYSHENIKYDYDYDLYGEITRRIGRNIETGEVMSDYTFEYNDKRKITKLTTSTGFVGEFTYNAKGQVVKFNDIKFKYSDTNLIEREFKGKKVKYSYDGDGRITSIGNEFKYTYTDTTMITDNYFDDGRYKYKTVTKKNGVETKFYEYKYKGDNSFDYCISSSDYKVANPLRKSYYDGSTSNLNLKGYVSIKYLDNSDISEQEIFDSSGNKIYTVKYKYTKIGNIPIWYDYKGKIIITPLDIKWIMRLTNSSFHK